MSAKPVILLAFADDQNGDFLEKLMVEAIMIQEHFKGMEDAGELFVDNLYYVKLAKVIDAFSRYINRIRIFHYGGHANSDHLLFEDGMVNATGLATMIAQQKGIRLVFLNGCSTFDQVEKLLDEGVPAVIATRAPINDKMATELASHFYNFLSQGSTLEQAFLSAVGAISADNRFEIPEDGIKLFRAARRRNDQPQEKIPWGLYIKNEEILNWKLNDAVSAPSKVDPKTIGIVHKALKNLNYSDQFKLFKDHTLAERIGAFAIHGTQHLGPRWLYNRLLESKRVNLLTSEPIAIHLNNLRTGKYLTKIKAELRKSIGVSGTFANDAEEFAAIRKGMIAQLESSSLVIQITGPELFVQEDNAAFKTFREEFWEPMAQEIKRNPPTNRLFLFFLREDGALTNSLNFLPIVDYAKPENEPERIKKVLDLSPIQPISVKDFGDWIEKMKEDEVDEVLNRTTPLQTNPVLLKKFLEECREGSPLTVISNMCSDYFDIEFDTLKSQWIKY